MSRSTFASPAGSVLAISRYTEPRKERPDGTARTWSFSNYPDRTHGDRSDRRAGHSASGAEKIRRRGEWAVIRRPDRLGYKEDPTRACHQRRAAASKKSSRWVENAPGAGPDAPR